jgi:hypothetical protein
MPNYSCALTMTVLGELKRGALADALAMAVMIPLPWKQVYYVDLDTFPDANHIG